MQNIHLRFPKGLKKCVTLSYDDGKVYDRDLVEILNKYKIKATFCLNSKNLDKDTYVKSSEIKELYGGHEIACHTYSHPYIENMPIGQVILEILEDRKNLESICGYIVRGMSYPYGSYSDEIVSLLPSLGIEYSRIVGSSFNYDIPQDFYLWKATCHHNDNLLENAKRFLLPNHKDNLELLYVWGHSYEFYNDNNFNLIEEFCKMLYENPDIFFATNIEIADYIKASKNLKFSADFSMVYNPSNLDIYLDVGGKIVKAEKGKLLRL